MNVLAREDRGQVVHLAQPHQKQLGWYIYTDLKNYTNFTLVMIEDLAQSLSIRIESKTAKATLRVLKTGHVSILRHHDTVNIKNNKGKDLAGFVHSKDIEDTNWVEFVTHYMQD
jgi:hypothetical protein